jgi:hypothetical protein
VTWLGAPSAAIRGKDAAGQREFPHTVLLAQRGRERPIAARHFAQRVLIKVFELRRGALGGGNLLQRIRLRPLLHQSHERPRPMRRMQRDETKFPAAHASHQSLDILVRHERVLYMTPPDDHVGLVQRRFIETLRRRSQRDTSSPTSPGFRREMRRDGFAEELLSVGALLLRLLLVPNEHTDGTRSGCRQIICGHQQRKHDGAQHLEPGEESISHGR